MALHWRMGPIKKRVEDKDMTLPSEYSTPNATILRKRTAVPYRMKNRPKKGQLPSEKHWQSTKFVRNEYFRKCDFNQPSRGDFREILSRSHGQNAKRRKGAC